MSSISPTHSPVQHGITDWAPVAVRHTVTHLLDPGCFASWLHAQPPERRLYVSHHVSDDGGRCVLGVYLHDEGFVHVTVSKNDCYVDGLDGLGPVELPPWAKEFVFAIDHSGATYRDDVVAVFEAVLAERADRGKPMAFEDWRMNRTVA